MEAYSPDRYHTRHTDHDCQNLYLACEAINAGTWDIAAYDQEKLDELLGLDGEDEFAVYFAIVGKVKKR